MKHCGRRITKLIDDKRVVKKEIAEYVGQKPQNLARMLTKASLDAATLEKFCMFLKVDPAEFFDYRPESSKPKTAIGAIDQKVGMGQALVSVDGSVGDLVMELIKEKDARIASLEYTISLLRKQTEDTGGE